MGQVEWWAKMLDIARRTCHAVVATSIPPFWYEKHILVAGEDCVATRGDRKNRAVISDFYWGVLGIY